MAEDRDAWMPRRHRMGWSLGKQPRRHSVPPLGRPHANSPGLCLARPRKGFAQVAKELSGSVIRDSNRAWMLSISDSMAARNSPTAEGAE